MNWLLTSSANPENFGLAAKGLATLFSVLALAGLLDQTTADQGAQAAINVLQALGTLLSAGMIFIGLMRKIQLGRWAHPEA